MEVNNPLARFLLNLAVFLFLGVVMWAVVAIGLMIRTFSQWETPSFRHIILTIIPVVVIGACVLLWKMLFRPRT